MGDKLLTFQVETCNDFVVLKQHFDFSLVKVKCVYCWKFDK